MQQPVIYNMPEWVKYNVVRSFTITLKYTTDAFVDTDGAIVSFKVNDSLGGLPLSLTTLNGGITILATGVIQVNTITHLSLELGAYSYKLEVFKDNVTTIYLVGSVNVVNVPSSGCCDALRKNGCGSDINVVVDYSEKGDKGDEGDSAYEIAVSEGFVGTVDEWLLSLQQPALDAAEIANEATSNANAATSSANEATSNANEATSNANEATDIALDAAATANASAANADQKATLANTATTNANNAANTANNAANNADQKATLANNAAATANAATANANTATNNANNAAATANAAKGWTPIHTIEADGVDRQVRKLTDYIGGTGNKPTDNIGLYLTDSNTYTANKSLAGNAKGAPGITTTNMATNKILGRTSAGTGAPQELDVIGSVLNGGKHYNALSSNHAGYPVCRINNPVGGALFNYGVVTGAFRIKVPDASSATTIINGTIFSYTNFESVSFVISCYPGSFGNGASATFIGGISHPVRWYNGPTGERYIYIGDLTTNWNFSSISIDRVTTGLSSDLVYTAGWDISLQTTFDGTQVMSRTAEQTRPLSNQNQILTGFLVGANSPVVNTDTKNQRDGKFQAQLNDRYSQSQSRSLFLPAKVHNPNNGLLIATSIPDSGDSTMFTLQIVGNGYSSKRPFNILFQAYRYNPDLSIVGVDAIAIGETVPISVFAMSGFIHFWLPNVGNSAGYNITVSRTFSMIGTPLGGNLVTSTSNVVMPVAGVSSLVTITPILVSLVGRLQVDNTVTAIQFDKKRSYGTNAAPITAAAITTDANGAQIGVTSKLFIKRATAPTFPAEWKLSSLSSAWHATNVNRIYAEYEDAANIYYRISN